MLMLRILLVDDSANDRALATRSLMQTFDHINITEIKSPKELEQALQAGNFDVVITDYQLRWDNGLDVLRRIKQRYEQRPVVMFTNSGSQEVAVEGMKAGLDDYVLKSPKHYVRLPIAVRLAWERALDRQRAAQLEIRLQSLLNRLEVGMFRATLGSEIVEANAAFLRLLGVNQPYEAQSFLNQQLSRNTTESLDWVERLETEGSLPPQETEIYRSDGTLVWIRWNWALISINGTSFIDGLIEDVSDRKQLEMMLRANTKELEEANRLKDEFLTTLSHELRTPLNAILGWSKLLQTGQIKNQETVEKALESMERNATLQLRLVEDTLDISNIIRGQLKLDIHLTHLSQIIDQVLDVVQPAVRAKSLQLKVDRSPYLERVPADPNRLQQIIWNLLSNAIKFTPDHGQIDLKVQPVGNYAEISVKDSGIGISTEFLPYVFDRFRQQDSSTTRSYEGLGLGLAIVRYLTEMHGGHIHVESPGMDLGTTFTVCLPLHSQPNPIDTSEDTGDRAENLRW
jgi:PAS domain S-box-containing protein